MLVCSCCNKNSKALVEHHWYEPPDYHLHFAHICPACNSFLKPENLWGRRGKSKWMNHILPSWRLQVLYYTNPGEYWRRLADTYAFPLPYREALDGVYNGGNVTTVYEALMRSVFC